MDKSAHLATESELTGGSITANGTYKMVDGSYENPGPTKNLRGVEANTARTKGEPLGEMQGITKIEYAKGSTPPVDQFRTRL